MPRLAPCNLILPPGHPHQPPQPPGMGRAYVRHALAKGAELPCRRLPRQWESGNLGGKAGIWVEKRGRGRSRRAAGAQYGAGGPPSRAPVCNGNGSGCHGTPPSSAPGREQGCTHPHTQPGPTSRGWVPPRHPPLPLASLSQGPLAGLGVFERGHRSKRGPGIPTRLISVAATLRQTWPASDPRQEGTAPKPWGHAAFRG